MFYIGSLSSLVLLACLLTYLYTQSLTSEYQNKIDQLSTSLIAEKKRFLRNAVERTLYLIESEREYVRKLYGESLSDEELENKTKARIGDLIRQLRLIDNGYIWVNRIVNWDGGDNYAIRAIHPNLPNTEGVGYPQTPRTLMVTGHMRRNLPVLKSMGNFF